MCSIKGFNFKNEDLIEKMIKITCHREPGQEAFYDDHISKKEYNLDIIISPFKFNQKWDYASI